MQVCVSAGGECFRGAGAGRRGVQAFMYVYIYTCTFLKARVYLGINFVLLLLIFSCCFCFESVKNTKLLTYSCIQLLIVYIHCSVFKRVLNIVCISCSVLTSLNCLFGG